VQGPQDEMKVRHVLEQEQEQEQADEMKVQHALEQEQE
jgi:hypothetical protein